MDTEIGEFVKRLSSLKHDIDNSYYVDRPSHSDPNFYMLNILSSRLRRANDHIVEAIHILAGNKYTKYL